MTKYFCDMCKSKIPDAVAPIRMQVGQKMHEFCNDCWVGLRDILEGTGTPIVTPPLVVNGPFAPNPFGVPNTVPTVPDLWKDMIGNGGLPNLQGIQITYSNNSPAFPASAVSDYLPEPKTSELEIESPSSKGIFANLYLKPGWSFRDAVNNHLAKTSTVSSLAV